MKTDPPWYTIIDGEHGKTLEMRDPNSGQDPNPKAKPRFQYAVFGHVLVRRMLPAESVGGDEWLGNDEVAPWWEPMLHLPPGGPLADFFSEYYFAKGETTPAEYVANAQYMFGHIVAFTPNGREVRREDDGLIVQPHNDNYWLRVPHMRAAREAFHHPEKWR